MPQLITLKNIEITRPSDTDRRADDQRIRDALSLDSLEIPLQVLRNLRIRKERNLSCVLGKTRQGHRLIETGVVRSYAVAIDIGTTNMATVLYDNISQKVVSRLKTANPQTGFGSDILTRMHHAMQDRADEISGHLINGVNSVIRKLCENAGAGLHEVHALTAAGNTVMSHFFLGLDVSRIPVEPFTPVVRKPDFFTAKDLGLGIHPEALIYVFPNAGSYVGGDILSGIIASGIFESDEPSVLIDVGTNAEVVIGSRDWLLVGAGAAGPALEEGIAGIGKRAEDGIVYDIEIRDSSVKCLTFNNTTPQGICGSGMVSLVYEMYCCGIIGSDGILNHEHRDVHTVNGEKTFSLSCTPGNELVIRQTEIHNFLRSKAAMFTLLLVLLRSVGLQFSDIQKVYVAGALGNGIDAQKACGIGMLPAWPPGIITPAGNASLKGAEMVLQDSSRIDRADGITDIITYKHMHDDPEFMKEFRGAIFIPHTNPDLLKV